MKPDGILFKLRNILYRARVRYWLESKAHHRLMKWVWPFADEAVGLRQIHSNRHRVFHDAVDFQICDDDARVEFERRTRPWLVQRDVIFETKGDITIESSLGLAILGSNHFVRQTRGPWHDVVYPPIIRSKLEILKNEGENLPELLHCDGFLGRNLYHFIADALNPLIMVRESRLLAPDVPVLITEQVAETPFGRYFLDLPAFRLVNWRIQKRGETLRTQALYKGFASLHWFRSTYDLLAVTSKKNPQRKIFLDRTSKYQRCLTNSQEVASILKGAGFERVFAEHLTYDEQARLFAETKYLVALHGAGMTNMLHADISRLRVLEISSAELLNPHFYWMCRVLGAEYYSVVVGSSFDINWDYSVDSVKLERQVAQLLGSDTGATEI